MKAKLSIWSTPCERRAQEYEAAPEKIGGALPIDDAGEDGHGDGSRRAF